MNDTEPHIGDAGTAAGQTIEGFEVTRRVRRRGCAAVYHARSPDGTAVALKTLCRSASARQQSRFDNELAALSRLRDCPHVPTLQGTGTVGPQRYLAFEWRPGLSLRRMPVPDPNRETLQGAHRFTKVALPVVRAFVRLHAFGVAHGDVSRNNILVAAGMVSLIDLESAADHAPDIVDGDEPHRKCTWVYAPPEYARENHTAGRTWRPTFAADQYSVAAVLYRQLTGQRHRASAPDGVHRDARKVLDVAPRPLTGWQARRWPALPTVFARALAPAPRDRFTSLDEFTAALEQALHD